MANNGWLRRKSFWVSVAIATALVGAAAANGAARALITGAQIKAHTITARELSGSLIDSLRGKKGDGGAAGQQGERGDQGAQGQRGDQGAQGERGENGAEGERGEKGVQGERGDQGAQGERGDQGALGQRGERGAQGDQGERGDQGAQGERGDEGQRGDQGAQGVQGVQGARGDQGAQGLQGESGSQGVAGQSLVYHAITPPDPAHSNLNVVDGVPSAASTSGDPLPGGNEGVAVVDPFHLDAGTYLISSTVGFFDLDNNDAGGPEYGVMKTWLCTSSDVASCAEPSVGSLWTADIPDDATNGAQQSSTILLDVPTGGDWVVSRAVVRGG